VLSFEHHRRSLEREDQFVVLVVRPQFGRHDTDVVAGVAESLVADLAFGETRVAVIEGRLV
jgi:hypothetical protein